MLCWIVAVKIPFWKGITERTKDFTRKCKYHCENAKWRKEESVVIDGLEVANGGNFNSDGKWIRLPKTYSKETFSIGGGSFASKQLEKWTYLDKIEGEICQGKNMNIEILIGANCSEPLQPVKVINSENG